MNKIKDDKTLLKPEFTENLVLNVSGAMYLKFPVKFKDNFQIQTAVPESYSINTVGDNTELTFVFSNKKLKKVPK
ncbi:MAG: hypothetical protein WC623_22155 [Pedobacter sp.]|uniref:hypothetical protein n=1 Tax=Pedobacter sp. TaxID=1411316 RepID=UPI0035692B00